MKQTSFLALLIILSAFFAQASMAQSTENTKQTATAVRVFVTNYEGDGITVIDADKGLPVAQIATGTHPHGVAISPDGKKVYVSNEGDGTLSIIDPATNQAIKTAKVGQKPHQITVSADSRLVFVALNGNDALAVVDAAQAKVIKKIKVGRAPHIALLSPDGETVYVTSEGDMKLVAVNAKTLKIAGETPVLAWPRVLAITPDGGRIYQTIRWLNGALVIDAVKREVIDRIALGEPDFAKEGKELWLTTQTTGEVTYIAIENNKPLGKIQVGHDPNWVEFTPDDKLAAVSNTASATVCLIDVAQHKLVAEVQVGKSPKRLAVGLVQTQ